MNQTGKDVSINKAISLLNEGHIKKSLEEALSARKKYPDEPFIYNLLGVLYFHIGNYEDSIRNYSEAIKLNPGYFEAYNNVGVAHTKWRKTNKAIECFDKAIQINPSYAEAYNNKGNALKDKGEYGLAAESYERSVALNPNNIDAISNLGIIWDLMNDFTKAVRYFREALLLGPRNITILYNLANCLFNAEDFKEAIEICSKIIALDASFYYAYNRMGLCYIQLGEEEKSIAFFEKALQIRPDYVEGLTNYGFVLRKLRNYSLATVQFKKALSIDPNSNEALVNLVEAYFNEGFLPKAIELAKKGLISKPNNIPLLKNLIQSLILLDRLEEASLACKKLLSINKNDADTINVMGLICERKGFFKDAKYHFLKALKLNKNLVLAKINIATLHQLEGEIEAANEIYNDLLKQYPKNSEVLYRQSAFALMLESFEEGWKNYEYRWKVFPMNKATWPFQDRPVWKGERSKQVVLWREQGIGDQIIFLGLALEVKEMCKTLSVYVDPRLEALCRRAMPGINFITDEKILKREKFDYHLPLGSVPGLLRNDISDFDRTVKGYLKADPKRVEAIRTELKLEGKTAIGISWRSFNSLNKTKKSIQLRDMERLFSGLDVVLVNLQYGDVEDEIREFKEATGIEVVQCASVDNREDLDGLAALIEVCDLVVSIPNVTVHLAGALAKETWVLLPYVAIFWWLIERTDSIWYPSSTLYRQPKLDDWDSVYASIRKDLQSKWCKKKSSIK